MFNLITQVRGRAGPPTFLAQIRTSNVSVGIGLFIFVFKKSPQDSQVWTNNNQNVKINSIIDIEFAAPWCFDGVKGQYLEDHPRIYRTYLWITRIL